MTEWTRISKTDGNTTRETSELYLFKKKKVVFISLIKKESDLDEEIQLLEEEIARLKAQKRLIQLQSPRKSEEYSENNGYSSPSSSPLSPASSPSPSPSISLSQISPDDRTRTSHSEVNLQNAEKESPQLSKTQSRKRSLSSTYAGISIVEGEEKVMHKK